MDQQIKQAANYIKNAKHLVAFTGAGISAESNIPTFRGKGGIWDKYDPIILDIDYFKNNADTAWKHIKDMFYNVIDKAEPNPAHFVLAELEKKGLLKAIITQNIDNLHQKAGSNHVIEFHGNTRKLVCLSCNHNVLVAETDLKQSSITCPKCQGILKPDFVFFGEPIPSDAYSQSFNHTKEADVYLIIGTTGVIMPASIIPFEASRNNAKIIEINITETTYTHQITDIFLQGKATEILTKLLQEI